MPIEPVDPSKKPSGDGQEKYPAKPKHGPGKFDDVLEKAKTDRMVEKEQIRKMGDALDKAGVPLPKPDTFPKTTAAFEAIAKSDAERAERKAEKARAEISRMAEEQRAKVESERPRTYTERLQDMGRLPKSGGGSGGGGMPKLNRDITKNYKKGGAVKSASARADGCCIKGKTRA
jgi:hypothetical protein